MKRTLILSCMLAAYICNCVMGSEMDFVIYRGACDSSAAFYAGGDRFVAADDENNRLRVFNSIKPGGPEAVLSEVAKFLASGGEEIEADIEGSAVIGDLVFWTGSHGRNKNGKLRPGRQVFFATRFESDSSGFRVRPFGRVYHRLLEDMIDSDLLKEYDLADIIRLDDPEKKKLAPKKDGINIEALAASPEGQLYIGLRNPLFNDDKALVIKLDNPKAMVETGVRAKIGGVYELDLAGRGIRAMEYDSVRKHYYIIAGEKGAENRFSIYSWDGVGKAVELMPLTEGEKFNPEAMFIRDDELYLLSDDGAVEVKVDSAAECVAGEMLANGNCPNKYLIDESKRTFRMLKLSLKDLND